MADDPIRRQEFEGYVRRHEGDDVAHSRMRHQLRSELTEPIGSLGVRMTSLERWQQRITGGLIFAALLIGSGAITLVVEWLRK